MIPTLAASGGGLVPLSIIVILGIAAQWAAWRMRLPSILLLLAAGLTIGPVWELFTDHKLIDPKDVLGDVLIPFVSLSVAIILFEGGMTLKIADLRKVGRPLFYLCTIGVVITWLVGLLAAHFVLAVNWQVAILIGAILTVTGPTVITPLLQHIRPTGRSASILKWEGIVIDPIGAMLAVLVFEVILAAASGADANLPMALFHTVVTASIIGAVLAITLGWLIRHYMIPDRLHAAIALAFAVMAFAGANAFQPESGLWAVTLMGIVLANQKNTEVEHILEFKENVVVLLISMLFIILAARIGGNTLAQIGWREGIFVLALILIARPVAAWCSTIGCKLKSAERWFIGFLAPRGIVAAAVASIFALQLENKNVEGHETIVTAVFATIVGTVVVYGLTTPLAARKLGVAEANPQGLLIIGATKWIRDIAEVLGKRGIRTLMVDTNRANVSDARMAGLNAYHGSILSESTVENLNLGGIGRVLAMTPNDWVNTIAVGELARLFGRANVYQIAPQKYDESKTEDHHHLYGRSLFGKEVTWSLLNARILSGAVVKATNISDEFNFDDFREQYPNAIVLFIINVEGKLKIIDDQSADPKKGDVIIAIVFEESKVKANANL